MRSAYHIAGGSHPVRSPGAAKMYEAWDKAGRSRRVESRSIILAATYPIGGSGGPGAWFYCRSWRKQTLL
jgi:hypothetical protein